jgi:hypothetical protein
VKTRAEWIPDAGAGAIESGVTHITGHDRDQLLLLLRNHRRREVGHVFPIYFWFLPRPRLIGYRGRRKSR